MPKLTRRWLPLAAALALVVGLPAARAQAPYAVIHGLTPIPPDIAARLPSYCRYDLDLSATPRPHAALLAETNPGTKTCPFVAGSPGLVHIFDQGACNPKAYSALRPRAATPLGGRDYRAQSACADAGEGGLPPPPAERGGRAFLLSYDPDAIAAADLAAFRAHLMALPRIGAPVVVAAEARRQARGKRLDLGTAFVCLQLLPGTATDALGVFRDAGVPAPAAVRQEEVTGQDCGKLAPRRAKPVAMLSGAASPPSHSWSFQLWLNDPAQPRDEPEAFAERMREILARDGVEAVRGPPELTFLYERERVLRTRDGGYFSIEGGPGFHAIQLRALTPGVCRAIFDLVDGGGLTVQTFEADLIDLRPRGLSTAGMDPAEAKSLIPVADGPDLCAMLKPGFEEWRRTAASRPVDLHDIKPSTGGFMIFGVVAPEAPKPDTPKP